MKIFVLTKKSLIIYGITAMLMIALIFIGITDAIPVFSPSANGNLPIYSVEREGKTVAITFDAAWEDKDAADIMAILAKYNVRATVFVTGDFADRCPKTVQALAAAGHEIANHSDAHPHPNKLSDEQLKADTQKCDEKIKALTGKNVPLYRSPYGEYNDKVVQTIHSMGYSFIQWDTDSLDYENLTPDEITKRVVSRTKPGSIVLFHIGTKNGAKALPTILQSLADDGYTFLPVSELIYKEGFYIDHKGRQIIKERTITSVD